MSASLFDRCKELFDGYSSDFLQFDGHVKAVTLKIKHTYDVCRVTEKMTEMTGTFSPPEVMTFRLAALFHDVSRFEQFKLFKTFRDDVSFDHGTRSAEIIREKGFLDGCPSEMTEAVIEAVRLHNKFMLPPDLPPHILPAAKMVRDADKTDILRLVTEYMKQHRNSGDKTIGLDLPDTAGFSVSLAEKVMRGERAQHKDMRNVNDFILVLFSWAVDVNYPAAAKLIIESGAYDEARKLLPENEPMLDELRDFTLSVLKAKAAEKV